MADSFSWTDTLRSCLPCIRPYPSDTVSSGGSGGGATLIFDSSSNAINRIPRARPDELQGLLLEDDSDALSLHSNVGRGRQNTRHLKKKKRKSNPNNNGNGGLRLFGYDLFGRRAAPIQLPDDTEDPLYNTHPDGPSSRATPPRLGATTSIGTTATTSTFTFDSTSADPDASPLDLPASSSDILILAASRQREEEERKQQEQERKRLKKEKKEMKRLAKVLAEAERRGEGMPIGGLDGVEFEGFQGSGSGLVLGDGDADGKYPKMPTPSFFSPRKGTSKSTGTSSVSGSTRSAPPTREPHHHDAATNDDNEDDEAADLDGAMYSRPSTRPPLNPTLGSRARSQSYSSHSHSNRDYTPRLRRAEEESHSQPGSGKGSNAAFVPPDAKEVLARMQRSLAQDPSLQAQAHSQPPTPTSPFPSPFSVPPPPTNGEALFPSDLPHDKEKKHRKNGHKSKISKSSKGSSSTRSRSQSVSQHSRSQSQSQTAYSASGSGSPRIGFGVGNDEQGQGVQDDHQVLSGTIETGLGFFDVEDFNHSHSHAQAQVAKTTPSPSPLRTEFRKEPRVMKPRIQRVDDEDEFEGY